MKNINYISCKSVIEEVIDVLNMDSEVRWHSMIEWISTALRLIGAYPQYKVEECDIDFSEYRVELPQNIIHIEDIYVYKNADLYPYSTSSIFDKKILHPDFKIVNNIVYSPIESGKIKIKYLSIMVDDEGFPMIPDNPSYTQSLFWYIVSRLSLGGYTFKSKEISFMMANQMWLKYCGQARASISMPDGEEIEKLVSILRRVNPRKDTYESLFKLRNGSY